MSDDTIDDLELQLAAPQATGAPAELRGEVLRSTRRQLKGDRWDRRLGMLAAALLALGIGLNWTLNLTGERTTPHRSEIAGGAESIVEVGVVVAEATDAETGKRFAERLAAMQGSTLSREQSAAMEQEIQRRMRVGWLSKKEG